MQTWYKKQLFIITGFIFGVVCIALVLGAFGGFPGTIIEDHPTITTPTIVQEGQSKKDYYTYKGITGKTAYAILMEKEKAWVELDKSGMLVAINFRKADPKKKEFWAFYVNGKMASVGPAEYVTSNSDVIEWKIEKY